MSTLIKGRLPCPSCKSSDAYHLYDDGHSYCFSCKTTTRPESEPPKGDHSYQLLPYRGFDLKTLRHYGVVTKVEESGKPTAVLYPYGDQATKVRNLPKSFYSIGTIREAPLFGQDRFSAGQARAITITEGEDDALAAYEMLGSKYPVVSVQSSSSARKDCTRSFEYLNAFDKIYLCLDSDEPGQRAAQEIASLFDFNKIYNVQLTQHKDAQGYHGAKAWKEFSNIWWNAKKFVPDGVVSSFDEIDRIIDAEPLTSEATYPFPTLHEMTFGPRPGEVVLFTAYSGVGKTEVVRSIEYHLLKTTEKNLGVIHLEEEKERSVKGLVSYELQSPVHLPDTGVTKDQIKAAYRKLVGREDRLYLYSHFGSNDPDIILDTIRFLSGPCECRYIFLDHITMVVSGFDTDDERRKLDYISTRLAMMVRENDFTLFLVSHVNDDGQTRGSRNIANIADLHIQLKRSLQAETPEERNTTQLTIVKNRFASMTGPAGKLVFNPKTFTLAEARDFGLPPVDTANDNHQSLVG